jgi:hypothetical protein
MSRAFLLLLLFPSLAWARAGADVPYPVADVYSAAVRFVRIDRGCKVLDRDPDAAYVTFECKDGEETRRGALEIFRITLPGGVQGRAGARLQVALGDDPHYVELRFLELLERKLRDERGAPPPPSPRPSPDGGT